ncbi:cation-transporting P-type ATPase, partial [Verrucomicrobiota bacterium]
MNDNIHMLGAEEAQKLSIDELMKTLTSDSNAGLSTHEINKRLDEYGYNKLAEKKVNPYLNFLAYFWGPIPWMIEIAAILSAVLKHWA